MSKGPFYPGLFWSEAYSISLLGRYGGLLPIQPWETKKNCKRKETSLGRRKICRAASDLRAALQTPSHCHRSRVKRAEWASNTLRIGISARGVCINSVAAVHVINLKGRGDRYKKFIEHANTIEWKNDTKIVRVLAAEPSHSLLKKGAVFGAPAKQSVAESTIKRDKCRACVLSHIRALNLMT